MKLMITIASLLIGSAAVAMPAVGDYVKYDGTVTVGSNTYTGTLEQEITQANAGQYLVKETQIINGQSQTTQKWYKANDMMSDSDVQQILSTCTDFGGRIEDVATPAGSIKTCAVPMNNQSAGTAWYGAVPFGLVKADIMPSSTQHVILTINTFKRGN